MSEFHGGFVIESEEPSVGAVAHAIVLDYLEDTGHEPSQHDLIWFGRVGMPAVLLVVSDGELIAGRSVATWVGENLALGARLARAVGTRVWAYTYDSQAGTESLTEFDASGTLAEESEADWSEDEARALTLLADELGVSLSLLSHDLVFGTNPYRMPIMEPVDEAAFEGWLASRRSVSSPTPHGESSLFYMPANMARELEAVSMKLDATVDDVFESLWEATKRDVYRAVPVSELDESGASERFLDPPSARPAPIELPARSPREPLDESDKVGVRLALSLETLSELRELSIASDRSLSWLVQKAYALGRERLPA